MEFSIGAQFSRELNNDRLLVDKLNELLNNNLKTKVYHKEITKIYCSFICVSKGFEPFFMPRPLKIYKKEPAIEYEIKLDFDLFFKANAQERFDILKGEFIKNSKEILGDKRLKGFKLSEFISDVEKCFG